MLEQQAAKQQPDGAEGENPSASVDPAKADQFAEMIAAYGVLTERLQASHEQLTAKVERLQEQLASKDAQLQRSKRLAALGEMAAGIAHEIRNPLGAISLYADMLTDELTNKKRAANTTFCTDATRHISDAVRGLNAIVNDVLSFAREIKPRLRNMAVAALLDRVVAMHRPELDRAAVRVECFDDLDELQPLMVSVDPDLMSQALLNLVRNATDAMTELETDDRCITLDAQRSGKRLIMQVRDNGPGIDDDHVDRIFNPFFTTRNTGTGLGLAIVHRIVDAHGGTIAVHNDGGAVFELNLPVGSVEPAELAEEDSGATALEGVAA